LTRRARILTGLLLGLAALALLVVAINRPWFDEALAPELIGLRDSQVVFSGDNAYPEIAGFPRSDHRLIEMKSLECVARRYLDCAARLIAESGATNRPHRNPYTGIPMEFDAHAGVIWFECQKTAYHSPDPPPRCAAAIHRSAT
jgi:hypothetical protein